MAHQCHSTIHPTSQKAWWLADNTALIILLAALQSVQRENAETLHEYDDIAGEEMVIVHTL